MYKCTLHIASHHIHRITSRHVTSHRITSHCASNTVKTHCIAITKPDKHCPRPNVYFYFNFCLLYHFTWLLYVNVTSNSHSPSMQPTLTRNTNEYKKMIVYKRWLGHPNPNCPAIKLLPSLLCSACPAQSDQYGHRTPVDSAHMQFDCD